MTRLISALAAFACCALPAVAQSQPDRDAARMRRIEAGDLVSVGPGRAALRLDLKRLMAIYHVPGLSVAVIDGGRIAWAKGYGVTQAGTLSPVTVHTLFQAGSISKVVSAAGAMALVERGTLRLDEDVNGTLTSWKLPDNEFTRTQKVTLRRILSHTAGVTVHGFDGYAAGGPVPSLRQILDGESPATNVPVRVDLVPGTKWRYSGGAVEIEQQLMMDATGENFPALLRELILDKVGMTDSTFEQPLPPERAASAASGTHGMGETVAGKWQIIPQMAAAGLWTTPTDLARFAIEIAAEKHDLSRRVLAPETVRTMLAPQVDRVGELALGDGRHPDRMGLGFFLGDVSRPDLFGHIGDDPGFQAILLMFGDSGQGVALMANSENGIFVGDYLIERIAKEYGWQHFVAPARPRIGAESVLLAVLQTGGLPAALDAYRTLRTASASRYAITKNSLIALGYDLSMEGKRDDATRVMQLAVRDNPGFWNAYDSLGEMYANAGDKTRAIEAYAKSVELNPQNEGGIEALRKLRSAP